ncbi:MAG: mechanosensitive ion channel family protein [Rhodothermales bacterium]
MLSLSFRCLSFRSVPFLFGVLFLAATIVGTPAAARQAVGEPVAQAEDGAVSSDSTHVDGALASGAASRPDSLLAARLQAIFSHIEEFTSVSTSVVEGVVRLDGTVDHPDARRRVEELTSQIDGVVYVINDVDASTSVEARLTPAMARVQEYWDGFVSQLPVFAVALIIVLLFWAAGLFVGRWTRPAKWTGINPLLWGFVSRMVRGVLAAVGLLLAFDMLGITSLMGAVLGTAGIVGLAIGFAFKDIVENYLAGILLSVRRPFSVRDLIKVGEFEGQVVRLTSRELVLLTFEGNHVRLPNAHVFKNPLTNYTINPRRLFKFDVGISVDEDLQEVMAIGVETLAAMRGVLEDPHPFARVRELGESTVNVRFHGWVDQRETDFIKASSEAIRLVKAALDEADIEMPEPVYRIMTKAWPEREKAPGKSAVDVESQARQIDVAPDGKLDEQIQDDLDASDDENLLE